MPHKGFKHTPETIERMKAAAKRRAQDPVIRAKLGNGSRGKPKSEETKAKMSAAKKGRPLTEEHKAALVAGRSNYVMTDAHKAAIKAGKAAARARRLAMKPAYRVFNNEIGTFVQWFQHGETKGQIEAALRLFTAPKGHYELLSEDATAEDYDAFVARWEDLRPLPPRQLKLV